MSEGNKGKLNRLQHDLPEGLVVTAGWLSAKGYSAQLLNKYVAHAWLERLAQGVYRRPGGRLVWEQVVISLQTLLSFPILVGGRSALDLQGFAHYVAPETKTVHLYGPKPLPSWIDRLPLNVRFRFHNTSKLFRNDPVTLGLTSLAWNIKDTSTATTDAPHGASKSMPWGQWDWPLTLSTPERAVLEMLDGVPQHESFEQADQIMEGLTTLSPRRVQKLLADCNSVKVRRLFLFFADRHHHAWVKRLDKTQVDLGTGKRMLARGGRLDPHYLITVPEELYGDQ